MEATLDGIALEATSEENEAAGKDGQEARDLKATKADDAAVPVWLWNDAIREGLGEDPMMRGHTEGGIDRALEVLRSFLLARKYKLGVTRSYFGYIRDQYPDLGDRAERPLVEWNGRGYKWRSLGPNTVGKKIYQGWWNSFWDIARAEKFAGWDAIWHVGDATWWDWDSGSAPLYWR